MSKVRRSVDSDLVETDAILHHMALEFMVETGNALYAMQPKDRVAVLEAILGLVTALDGFPSELEPQAICSKQGKLLVTFNGEPERPPIVVELPQL